MGETGIVLRILGMDESQRGDPYKLDFVCTQIQKRAIPLNQAQFADGIRWVVCQVWTTGSLVLGKFRLFWVDFGHFQYGVISF